MINRSLKFLIILFVTLLSIQAYAQSDDDDVVVVGGVPAGGGSSYILEEKFEGVGEPANFEPDTDDNAPDYDYTTIHLEGDQSVELAENTDESTVYTLPSALGEVYVSLIMQISDVTPANAAFLQIRDATDTVLAYWQLRSDATTRVYNTGGTTDTSGGTFTAATPYWLKFRVKKGTGVDTAIVESWFAANTTAWGAATALTSDGDWTADATKIVFISNVSCQIVIDHVIVDDADIPITAYQ